MNHHGKHIKSLFNTMKKQNEDSTDTQCCVTEVSLTMAQYHSDIIMKKKCTQKSVGHYFVPRFCTFCAFTRQRCQVCIYRTIGPMVSILH